MPIEISWMTAQTTRLPEGGDLRETPFEVLVLDLVENENYEGPALVTKHVIESNSGADIPITDHVVPQSDQVTARVYVADRPTSNTPGATMTEVDVIGGKTASVMQLPEGTTRGADAFEKLLMLKNTGTRVDVDGLQRLLTGWVIENVSSPRSGDMTDVLICELTFTEIRIAEAQDTDAPSPRVERGRRRANRGNQTPQATGDATQTTGDAEERATEMQSWLHALIYGSDDES